MPPSPETDPLRDRFGRLCDELGEEARRFARLKLGAALRRRLDSEDLKQEVLLEAWRVFEAQPELHSLTGDGFKKWLGRVMQNKVLSLDRYHVKAQRRSVRREERIGHRTPGTAADRSPSAIAMTQEALAKLERAMDELTPKEQEVVRLVHLKGLRVAEAAERMGKTPGATSVLLSGALSKLEKGLGLSPRSRS